MDDNLADYRRFCANRLKRLERCKKTKSFCNLDDEVPYPFASSGSDLGLSRTENFASHGGSMTFSRCTENIALSSVKSETVPFCSGTKMFCSGSKTLPVTETPGSEVFSLNGLSSISDVNPIKFSPVADSWIDNSRKCPPITFNFVQTDKGDNNIRHLPPSPCSSYSSLTAALSTVSSQSSILSTNRPELVKRAIMTTVNNGNDCGDCNRGAQRNFDLLREKMISLMENDVRLLQQLLALGDSIQELKSKGQTHRCNHLSLNCFEEENDDDEEWWSNDNMQTAFGNSISAVTNLYVGDEPKENRNKQYFSRKNSVLRIPIPPKSSNRMSTNEKLHRRLSRLSKRCDQLHQKNQQQHELVENSSRRDFLPNVAVACPSSCQDKPFPLRASSTTVAMNQQSFGTTDTLISNGSIDSGIRDESCSSSSAGSLSPFLKNEKS